MHPSLRLSFTHLAGTDCYMFHVNQDVVLDSTSLGHYGRFANHSCSPSMYTKVCTGRGPYDGGGTSTQRRGLCATCGGPLR